MGQTQAPLNLFYLHSTQIQTEQMGSKCVFFLLIEPTTNAFPVLLSLETGTQRIFPAYNKNSMRLGHNNSFQLLDGIFNFWAAYLFMARLTQPSGQPQTKNTHKSSPRTSEWPLSTIGTRTHHKSSIPGAVLEQQKRLNKDRLLGGSFWAFLTQLPS